MCIVKFTKKGFAHALHFYKLINILLVNRLYLYAVDVETDIVAIASAPGEAAIALFRFSGPGVFTKLQTLFFAHSKSQQWPWPARKALLGNINFEGRTIDEVLLTAYPAPHSYTGQNLVEITCHGSVYIQRELLRCFYSSNIAPAEPGAFTLRAFLNGKLDLSQAEAVADVIAADSRAAHEQAMKQLRGGYSRHIEHMRLKLVDLAALLELELDFSEEDVTFANRSQLQELLHSANTHLQHLIDGFYWGNAVKTGIPLVIAGKPNAGKSTLLNALLQDERAIVSPIAGTTRDTLEERFTLGPYTYRIIDTAGLREGGDTIERLGIERSYKAIAQAVLVIYIWDAHAENFSQETFEAMQTHNPKAHIICVANKTDLNHAPQHNALAISAQQQTGIEELKQYLLEVTQHLQPQAEYIVTQARHVNALKHAQNALDAVDTAIKQNLSTDLLAFELREALQHLAEISGKVSSDELLTNIFSRFCIGK